LTEGSKMEYNTQRLFLYSFAITRRNCVQHYTTKLSSKSKNNIYLRIKTSKH